MFYRITRISAVVFICLSPLLLSAQKISISEKYDTIKTYPFYDPNPLPAMAINKKVSPFYPYSMIDGYTDKGVDQKWKVVKLENDFITVTVLPEVGGKVMGAIEKSTGKEFVYLNHVMKFRAVGIRGPWTSGGIEHNFGLDLGHAPWAAAPVDYALITNPDSSVTCVVGGLDLASRSDWRVKINLPKNKAYFETEALWFNPLPFHQAYLSWENAAFKASDDLQFFFPGNYHIGHDGLASSWPIDTSGRNLSFYRNNNFGGSKSYHVVGDYRNWFGGYWNNSSFGFGHWSAYADAPGKKLWIWSLARDGAIWEDLLTDKDGQYIEAQSGVKLNQAAERSGYHSPFRQLSHKLFYTDTKTDYWFPVKGTAGMVDANIYGTLNVDAGSDSLKVAISPLQDIRDSLVILVNNQKIYERKLNLATMETFRLALPRKVRAGDTLTVNIGNKKLYYSNHHESLVSRPVVANDSIASSNSAEQLFRMGEEQNAMRNYNEAMNFYNETVKLEPTHGEALSRIAELYYRRGRYNEGILYATRVLEFSTYDGGANFIYGALQAKLNNIDKAEEAFSIASYTMEFRSAAYTEIAALELKRKDFALARVYAQKSLDFNRYNLKAAEYLVAAQRKLNNLSESSAARNELLMIDPLNHFARFEKLLSSSGSAGNRAEFQAGIQNEFPQETYLEVALQYVNVGMNNEAIELLEMAPPYPTVYYWLAYLYRNTSAKKSKEFLTRAEAISPNLVFPFRPETLEILQWARDYDSSWKLFYYAGLIQWNNNNLSEAKELFKRCGNAPDYAPFYITRGILFGDDAENKKDALSDLEKARSMDAGEWRAWHALTDFYETNGSSIAQLENSNKAYLRFAANPVISIDYAKALLNSNKPKESISVLKRTLVLPQEGAREGHEIFALANTALALNNIEEKKYKTAITNLTDAKAYPENLGSGMPFDPDYRLLNFLLAYCEEQIGNKEKAMTYYNDIINYSADPDRFNDAGNPIENYISLLVLKKFDRQYKADALMKGWIKFEDSLNTWHISATRLSPQMKWVVAKYNGQPETATGHKTNIAQSGNVTRFSLFLKALEFINSKN